MSTLLFVLAASLAGLDDQAYADTLMYQPGGICASGVYASPIEAGQADAACDGYAVTGKICGALHDGSFHIYIEGNYSWDPAGPTCASIVVATCVAFDGSWYTPRDPFTYRCDCPSGEFWDSFSNVCTSGYYVTASRPPGAELGSQCCAGKPRVGDPVDPSNGNVSKRDEDFGSVGSDKSLLFARFGNSSDLVNTDMAATWLHSFSCNVKPINNSVPFPNDSNSSSLYATAGGACTNGFTQIQSLVSNWQGTATSYADGLCKLIKDGMTIGVLPVLTASTKLAVQLATPLGYEATRDDGQVIRFTMQDSVFKAPPGSDFKLQRTSTGLALIDDQDDVESYDSSGKLLSIASRTGVIQTMNYDSSGRLSTITDNFGHRLTLSYDGTGKLSAVTRQ